MAEKINWDKFDQEVDEEAVQEAIKQAEDGGGDFPEIPDGKYEVGLRNLEMKLTKKGDPMLSAQFQILNGEFENNYIFFNQVLQNTATYFGMQVNSANRMLRGLWDLDEKDQQVSYTSMSQYSELVLDIFEDIGDKYEYVLEKGTTKKGYDTLDIIEVFELED
ncbi:DUF669 domain-containing protein [Listeria booriae]|uniref:DUF669 domain-containing protein n=1 Tax=Listeria booriae TaxID=1552123 RepID=UPI001626086D|nr:DUF669 domain-containing protein [Listeria booriae]MBC2367815.1 DUF669 domain-containing protein [Listeria booriae]